MAYLHIFKGSYGSIAPAPDDAIGMPQVTFQVDEALAQCSPSLQALVRAHNPAVPAGEITTIEASDDVLNAVKAMLARALQAQWNRSYEQVLATLDSRISMGGPAVNAVLALAQAGGATLGEAVRAEQETANMGIERVVAQLNDIAPYWMNVELKGVYVTHSGDGMLRNSNAHEIHPIPVETEPVPMVGWGDPDHPKAESRYLVGDEPVDGYYDITAAVPFYLPVDAGGAKAHAMRVADRQVFNFGQGSSAADTAEQSPVGPSIEKAQEVFDLVMSTPALRQAIVEQPSQTVIDFDSRVETSLELELLDDQQDYDGDDDDDDDYGYHNLPHSRPSGG